MSAASIGLGRRLFEIARVLSVPVSYYFDGLDAEGGRREARAKRMCSSSPETSRRSPTKAPGALSQLARALATSTSFPRNSGRAGFCRDRPIACVFDAALEVAGCGLCLRRGGAH